jgi:peptidoglycan/LPS O-acetylase OafA/YrhL
MLVVLFHLWPDRLTGGYVGVDVFFAISGYLITGHLLREADTEQGIRLPAFWARRIRRLTPAAVLVLVATLVATVLFLPSRLWQLTVEQIAASALGFENWLLAIQSVDYFGADNQPTAAQHYWSLSLEEQFYLVWPIVLVGLFLVTRRVSARNRVRILGGAIALLAMASLVWSIVDTAASPSSAYFSTFTHAWEFALGALLALLHDRVAASRSDRLPRLRAVATWVGLAAILAAGVLFTGASPFPGWIALLPVGGALLVIAAGTSASRIQAPLLLASRPVQAIGDWSYSIYLWHWPLIVILPYALGHPIGTVTKIAILVATIVLGALAKRFVEDPVRLSPLLARPVWRSYLAFGLAAALVVGSAVGVGGVAARAAADAREEAEQSIQQLLDDPCFGAAAMAGNVSCPDSHRVSPEFGPDFAADDWGSIAGVTKDGTLPDKLQCIDFSGDGSGFLDCTRGDPSSATTIAIVGDSHALALFEAIERLAEANGWKVRGILRNSCTPSLPMRYDSPETKADCNKWRDAMAGRIADDDSIDVVVAAGFTRGEPEPVFQGTREDLLHDYADLWQRWADAGKRVYAIADAPQMNGEPVPDCVQLHQAADDPCAVPRDDGLVFDPVVEAARRDGSAAQLVDLTGAFCDESTCHAVIGGVIAFRDPDHLSATFALTLIPRLRAVITAP